MEVTQAEQAEHNRAEQAALYGAPLGAIVADLTSTLELTQAGLARLLGLSAPMLSQLASGHRIKIGNPSAVQRLQRLVELLPDVRHGRLLPEEAVAMVTEEAPGAVLTRTTTALAERGAADVQRVLRWAADAAELERAAAAIEAESPALAEVLRVYGTGRSADAARHFRRLLG